MITKIQNLNGTHNDKMIYDDLIELFMITKIQNLNGTHNARLIVIITKSVVYDYKDTKFEWNSQPIACHSAFFSVVYDYKDTKFEWNSQHVKFYMYHFPVVYDYKDTKFEWNSQPCSLLAHIVTRCL